MSDSRTKNSKRNIISGAFRQVLNIGLAFVSRTIVIYLMGEQFLGLGSLFSSILAVLNLADLGFTTAVVCVLYKPVAENDRDAICAIIAYLKRIYTVIGTVIFLGGMAVLPFLNSLINGGYPDGINIYVLYFMYLGNTVVSYWMFAYKSALFTAMQRADVVDNIYSVSSCLMKVSQLALLLIFRNYYLYTLILPLGTVLNNLLLHFYSRKFFPDILPKGKLPGSIRETLNKQVRAIFIGKVGDVARNSCDSIFLSAMLGLTTVAVYDNYMYIFNSIIGVVWMVCNAVQASIGNSMVKESVEKNLEDFYRFDFIFAWINGWCTICLCCLYQPFMQIWMKGDPDLMLSNFNMVLISFYFYAVAVNNVRNLYVNGAGLFWNLRIWYILEAAGNIILNLVLGYFFGVTGIILATLITVFFFNFIARSNVLFGNYFKTPVKTFYANHLKYFLILVANCLVTFLCCNLVKLDGWAGLILRGVLCVLVPNVLFFLVYCKTGVFQRSVQLAKAVLKAR